MYSSCAERKIPETPEIPDKYEGRNKIKLTTWGYYNEGDLHKCDFAFISKEFDLIFELTYSMPIEATSLPFGSWTIANNQEYTNLIMSDTVSGWRCIVIDDGYLGRIEYYQIIDGKMSITEDYVDFDINSVKNQPNIKNLKFRTFDVKDKIRYSR
jgi:hypothetical protein